MRRIMLALSLILFTSPAIAALTTYTLVPDKSSLKFYAIQNGAPAEGEFKRFNADIKLDPDKPEASHISAEVDTGSVSSANDEMESNLKLPEWLSTAAFPKATFVSDKVSRMPNSDNYYAQGKLTIRDKTVPVEVEFQLKDFSDHAIAEGYFTIHRNDFGIGQGEWSRDDVVKNEVRVQFRLTATK